MSANLFGHHFKLFTFGESHGPAMGAVIDGCPANVPFDQVLLERELSRRRPGQSLVVTARDELDRPEVLSGVFEGKTLGTPIALLVRNESARGSDYLEIRQRPRPGHADDVWVKKFGHVDWRGGGRASGRETVSRVLGGAVAEMVIGQIAPSVNVIAFAREIASVHLEDSEFAMPSGSRRERVDFIDRSIVRMPSERKSTEVEHLLIQAREFGRSYGGVVEIWIEGLPEGLGQPVFHKLKSDLATAVLSVGATMAFELGDGFGAARKEGGEYFSNPEAEPGIRGGIATGHKIRLRVGIKPTSSVLDVAKAGRHDPCIVPRVIPVLEAMVHLVILDHLLWRKLDRI